MPAKDTAISVAFLFECFDADVGTGSLTPKRRPRPHFISDHEWKRWNTRYAGQKAGGKNGRYSLLRVQFEGVDYVTTVHRILWAMANGEWPPAEVDHAQGREAGNAVTNLRPATHAQNHQNRAKQRNNASGYPGVSRSAGERKWSAEIMLDGRAFYLGRFDTPRTPMPPISAPKQFCIRSPRRPEASRL